MKKLMLITGISMSFILTGCSVDLDMSTSETEEFAMEVEKLADVFMDTKGELESLKENKSLSEEDEQLISKRVDELIDQMDEFKEENSSIVAKLAQTVAEEKLNEKEEILKNIKDKIKNQQVEMSDLDTILEVVSADVEWKLFE